MTQVATLKVQLQDAKPHSSREDNGSVCGPEVGRLKDQACSGLPFPDVSKLRSDTDCGLFALMWGKQMWCTEYTSQQMTLHRLCI